MKKATDVPFILLFFEPHIFSTKSETKIGCFCWIFCKQEKIILKFFLFLKKRTKFDSADFFKD